MKSHIPCALLILAVASAAVGVHSACTSDTNVKGVSIDSPTTAFPQAATIALPDIIVRTVGSWGEFLPTPGIETVTVAAPAGTWGSSLACTGSGCTVTTAGGVATFTGLTLTGTPAVGTFFLEFSVCGGSFTDKLETVISAGTAAKIVWNRQPEATITSYGYVHLQPRIAYADASDIVSSVVHVGSVFELVSSDPTIVIKSATVTPTSTSGNIIEFSSTYYSMLCSPNCAGKTFTLSLASIGGQDEVAIGIPFPTPLTITVADCNHDFRITPALAGVGFSNFVVPANPSGAATVGLRGWHFPSSAGTNGRCKYNGAVYPMIYSDMCNIACSLPGAVNSGYALQISLNGVVYETLGTLTLSGTAHGLTPSVSHVDLHKESYVITSIQFSMADSAGNKLLANAADEVITCTTEGSLAIAKRQVGSYHSPRTQQTETPNNSPTLSKGQAVVDFVYHSKVEADLYTYCCTTPTTVANPSCVELNVYEDCPSPPELVTVTAPGCTYSSPNFVECKTAGSEIITVTGKNFGRSGARMRIGSWWCTSTTHDAIDPNAKVYGHGCKGHSTGHNVLVFTPKMVYGMWSSGLYSFADAPIITQIAGCEYDFYPSTANCWLNGTSMVQIWGSNFGSAGAKVFFYYQVAIGATTYIEAATVTHNADGSINATGFPGTGQRFDIAVENANGEQTIEKYVTMSYVATVTIACPQSNGIQCAGNGDCKTNIGVCDCFSDSTNGFWTGSACDSCQSGYFGTTCTGVCPSSTNGVCSGAGFGTCDEGVAGSGLCTCASGYGGTSCQTDCPGGVSSPCSGRGTCQQHVDPPTCNCSANPTDGYWGGADCLTCDSLYVGASCQQLCPTYFTNPNNKCNNNGECASSSSGAVCINCVTADTCGSACELSGASCGVCPSGYYGTGCTSACPGIGGVCSLHGSCSEGVAGTGQCVCTAGYAGTACELSCPGTSDGNPCTGHGTCDTSLGICTCEPAYGTSDCSVSCPGLGLAAGTCSGRGICNSGASNDASCSCNLGYSGVMCDEECPGGVASPCSYHGTCHQNTTCSCYADQLLGFWTETTNCSKCVDGLWGANCNGTCPINNGVQCAYHGECTDAILCRCHASSSQGYWSEPNCTTCKANYWGSNCTEQCPGGACNACSGNGVCDDGIAGAGTCTCFVNATSGHWEGAKCNDCVASYYGSTCINQCPLVTGNVCNLKGSCFEGVSGNGTCACLSDDVNGFWGSSDCSECDSTHYGATCASVCTGITAAGLPCSGHGTCVSGIAGTGACVCHSGYGSADCSVGCEETAPGEYCSGHGICLQGATLAGGCDCYSSSDKGFWDTTNCGQCNASSYGASCIQSCPHNATGARCSLHGYCNYGVNGSGSCTCDEGYAGVDCGIECPGGILNPCSNHGTCDATYGTCSCYQDATLGFWTGSACSICSVSHNGSEAGGCLNPCPPTSSLTDVCSGHGTCQDGSCVTCDTGYCHDANEVEKACQQGGGCQSCPDGYYGTSCASLCPGGGTCSGHGFCERDEISVDLGTCKCFSGSGYFGTDCASQCPGGGTCNYHGVCDQTTGLCSCDDGYRLTDCSLECPGGASSQCSTHGQCLTDGTCSCTTGYATADCSVACPSELNITDADWTAAMVCYSHGQCIAADATCLCNSDSVNGFWTGSACEACQSGYFGSTCLEVCVNGYTSGTTCLCSELWSGAACDIGCPGNMGNSTHQQPCTNQGNCTWGHTMEQGGNCTCDANYYTATCAVYCSPTKCSSQPYYLVNGECDIGTGDCTCIDNSINGHWSDTSTFCQTCTILYYGPSCLQECQCGGHGTCDKDSGACECFDDDANGHYDGSSCDKCLEGYIGDTCKGKDVTVTRQRPCSAITTINDTSAFILMDTTYDVIMTGARPIIICNLTTKTQISILDINASVVSGRFSGDNIVLTLNRIDGEATWQAQKHIQVARGRSPTLAILDQGSVYAPDVSAQGNQSAVYSQRRALQEVHFYEEASLVETIDVDTNEILAVFSNGIVQHSLGLNTTVEYSFNGVFRQVQTAAVTDSVLISPSKLILGGSIAGVWKIVTVDLPLTANSPSMTTDITPTVTAASTYCSGTETCQSAAKIVTDGVWVYVATIRQKGVGVNKFRLTLLDDDAFLVEYNAIVATTLTVAPYPTYNVTAMILDEMSGAGFVAINNIVDTVQEASIIHKFDLLSLQVYGSARFQKVVDDYEIVKAFTKNEVTRTLYATVPLNEQLNIVPLNLFAVTNVYPAIADTVGGTVITVEGEGFINDPGFVCDFNGTEVTATFVSTREAHCVSPVGGDERCEGTPLEVTIGDDQLTNNDVALRRVSSPQITSVYSLRFVLNKTDNSYGNLTGGEVVIIEGSGFQDSAYLACRFKSDDYDDAQIAYLSDRDYSYSGGTQGVRFGNARFINATRIECDQPAFASPTRGTARVEVTLDGTVWSSTGKEYQVVGPASGMWTHRVVSGAWSRSFADTYESLEVVTLEPFIVWVVDSEYQRLRNLDATSHHMTINMTNFVSSSSNLTNLAANQSWYPDVCDYARTSTNTVPVAYNTLVGGSVNYTHTGYTIFQGWKFNRPPAGIYTFTIFDHTYDWSFNHTFLVNVGDPYILKICQEPPEYLDNLSPTLSRHPKLYVEDISGNQLPSTALSKTRVIAVYDSEETVTSSLTSDTRDLLGVPVNFSGAILKTENRVAQLDGNFLKFDQLEMKGLHGKEYYINFTGTGESSTPLVSAQSRAIKVKQCNDNTNNTNALQYFAKLGTSECFVCPDGGICDGSPDVVVGRNNLWRPSLDSYKFYDCSAPTSGDSCVSPNGTCITGYSGPRCSVCTDGYGKDGYYCIKCRTPGAIVGFMLLVISITLLFVVMLVYASFTTPTRETLPIIMKIAINHLQIASRINEIVEMPQALVDLFTVELALSELIRFDIISAECPPLELSVYGRFYLAVSVPFVVLTMFAVGYFVLFLYRRVKKIGPVYTPVIIDHKDKDGKPKQPVKRDRVMLTVSKFMAKLKGAAYQYHGDVTRDDLVPQYYTSTQYFVATSIIVLCLVYPTVLQWCASMWKCDAIVYGDADTLHTIYYLSIDRSVVCTDDSHQLVQALALSAALIYGAGVPLLSVVAVFRHWRQHGRVHTRRLYAYITAGFDVTTWWWESVVMGRKAVVVFIIIFVSDPILRTYLSMWTMTLALGVHGWFQPYDKSRPSLYYLEGLGITTLVVTLNLSLLFQFTDIFGTNSVPFWMLVVFLFMINVFVLLVYFIFVIIQMVKRVRAFVLGKKQEDDMMPDGDLKYQTEGGFGDEKGDFTSFHHMDRHELQREGLVGALRSAAKLKPNYTEERKVTASSLPAKAGETPFERVQRLEAERRKEALRVEQVNIQADLESELEELRDRMVRAQALAAAEEAIVSKNKDMAAARQRHEDELLRLMDEIRKERGEFVAKADNQKEFQKDLMQSIQFEMDEDEEDGGMNFEEDENAN